MGDLDDDLRLPDDELSLPDDRPVAPAAAAPTADDFRCPKCGKPQPKGPSCVKCGIIFARLKPVTGSAPELPAGVKLVVGNPEAAPKVAVPPRSVPPAPAAPPSLPMPPVLAPAAPPSLAPAPPVSARSEPPARPVAAPEPFFPSIGQAFLVPFLGKGALWIPIFAGVLLGGMIFRGWRGLVFNIGLVGMLANYFAKSLQVGMAGETRAPDLPQPHAIKAEFVYPGLALIALSVALWGPAIYVGASAASEVLEQEQAAYTKAFEKVAAEVGEIATREFDPEETFRGQSGRVVTFSEDDKAEIVEDADGRWVKVHPREGYVAIYPEGWKPGDPDPEKAYERLEASEEQRAEAESQASLGPRWFGKVPLGTRVLLILLLFLPFYYWPAAMGTAALTGNTFMIFNPFEVLPSAVKGGKEYAVVAGLGAALLLGPIVFALSTDLFERLSLVTTTVLVALAYCSSIQGFLVGRLAAARPGAFPEPAD